MFLIYLFFLRCYNEFWQRPPASFPGATILWIFLYRGVKIRRALGPAKLHAGPQNKHLPSPRRARRFWDDSNTVISPISEKRKSEPLKDCEGPQKYNINMIKGSNDHWQLFLILTPVYTYSYTSYTELNNAHLERSAPCNSPVKDQLSIKLCNKNQTISTTTLLLLWRHKYVLYHHICRGFWWFFPFIKDYWQQSATECLEKLFNDVFQCILNTNCSTIIYTVGYLYTYILFCWYSLPMITLHLELIMSRTSYHHKK